MPSTPSIRFFFAEELHAQTIKLLEAMEQADDPTDEREALGDLVVALTEAGLDYYFLKPLELAGAGFVASQSAGFGVASAKRLMAPVIRSIISGMDGDQLLIVCGFIREVMDWPRLRLVAASGRYPAIAITEAMDVDVGEWVRPSEPAQVGFRGLLFTAWTQIL